MRKALLIVLLACTPALAVQPKGKEMRSLVLPAPEFIYKDKDLDKFEREKEKLLREKELLQMKVEIAKLKSELKKYEVSNFSLKKGKKAATAVQRSQGPRINPELEFRKRYLQIRLERENLMRLEAKLSALQNLFTGVMQVGSKKVAFDSYGRKYTVGSVVDGARILEILDDGVVVGYGGHVFKVPIASAVAEKKKSASQFNAPAESVPPPAISWYALARVFFHHATECVPRG